MLGVCALQNGHVGVGCLFGEILCWYSVSSGNLFAVSCAMVLLVYLDNVCSYSFIFMM